MDLELFDHFTSSPAAGSSSSAALALPELPSLNNSLRKRQRLSSSNRHEDESDEEDQHEDKSRRFSEFTVSIKDEPTVKAEPEDGVTPVSKGPAKVYKFKLDPFQQEAVNHIERGESVLVAAHTSAGKTAVAEYAIAKSLRDKQRVIYTSPIKALSNQKYRDLQEEFGDVGLMTGDMTINPNASCLIMTTEILRSMLYRGSEVVREVAWVVYDEVHYMRDKERGVVWEESIILLPHKVRFVFLSATIPNAPAFVDWVSKIHHQPCHVVYTDYRPVPLQHYLFPANAEGLYLVVDEKGKFREENFQKAMASLQVNPITGEMDNGGEGQAKGSKSRKQVVKNLSADLMKIVNLIMSRQLDPCIIFSFSKKDCETYALQMSRMEFNNDDEKALIDKVFFNAIEGLSEDDKTLPQIHTLLPLLKRGIGIHHGGLLPILKEVIEILFQEGLIKCLFATETFSIGINMPAKTVVFTSTRKFDGKDFRWVTSGEYIQMSGRAGRRGKDDKGIVIQMLDEKMEPDVAKNMIYGASDPLYSSYHLGYNMLLNMMRVEGADPLNIVRSSFLQYQQEMSAPKLLKQAEEIEREVEFFSQQHRDVLHDKEEKVRDYLQIEALSEATERELNAIIMQPANCLPFLQTGRLLKVAYLGIEYGWGAVVALKKNETNGAGFKGGNKLPYKASQFIGRLGAKSVLQSEYYVEVLLEVRERDTKGDNTSNIASDDKIHVKTENSSSIASTTEEERERLRFTKLIEFDPCGTNIDTSDMSTRVSSNSKAKTEMRVVYVGLDAITRMSAIRLNVPVNNASIKAQAREGVKKAVNEVLRRFADGKGIPMLDAITDMGISHPALETLLTRRDELNARLHGNASMRAIGSDKALLGVYEAKQKLIAEAARLRVEAQSLQSVLMREELKKMKRVLRKLDFVSPTGVLSQKGRFACEVSAGDEVLLTNMVFGGAFNDLTVDQTVSLLSCFVFGEGGTKDGTDVNTFVSRIARTDMHRPFRALQSSAREVAKCCVEMKLFQEEDEYIAGFDPTMMDVAYAWSNGAKFSELCKMSEIFEGSIIRSLRRLEELLRQLASASMAIGNNELVKMFETGAQKIRRGVVFAASLYI